MVNKQIYKILILGIIMRMLMKKGKQKELIKGFKDKNNLTWKQVSNLLNIKKGKLMPYYYELSLISKRAYNQLDKEKKYNKYIVEQRKENWGQIKGGSISKGKTKEIKIPKESKELAELYGIILGDGNISKIQAYKAGTYMITIAGGLEKDKEYLINFVKPLIENLFNIKVKIKTVKNKNTLYLIVHGRKIVEFFENKGYIPGNKIKNQAGIPKWIQNNRKFLCACIRGLYDTDGSAYKLTNQNSYQINFCNKNKKLINETREGVINLGVLPSKITKGTDFNITKKSEIKKFYKSIGFNNSKHLNKIKMWNLS